MFAFTSLVKTVNVMPVVVGLSTEAEDQVTCVKTGNKEVIAALLSRSDHTFCKPRTIICVS